ncbi:MAG: TatD family hydrolase [Eggerthellaceae bacterium]|nr:TatD family hydrolase [Eggerthellaceae bacterium]
MHDMHCHLGFMENGEEVAADALTAGSLLFANTVTPDEWRDARKRFASFGNVVVGFGMHPWWVDERWRIEEELDGAQPDVIGEAGLDLGRRHAETRALQLRTFEAIASWAGSRGGKLLSLHSVHAAAETLEILERTGALESCTCIFHWFTGPSDLLKRAVQAGCLFSAGPRMLATGKGREYVKAIPVGQLLLETDAPPEQGQRYSYAELRAELESAAASIAGIKGADALEVIEATSRKLLALT